MHACTRCEGLIPSKAERCPHCEWTPSPAWRTAALAAAAALALSGCFEPPPVMAAYGVPCTVADCQSCNSTLSDGGLVKNDPAAKSRCSTDGGM